MTHHIIDAASDGMKALVKKERARGLWLEDVPEPEPGINDVKIAGEAHRDLRHRSPHLQMGRVGAEDDSGADGRRPRIRRRDRRGRRQRQRLFPRHDRLGRGPYRLRPLPQLHGRPAAPLPLHQRRRRQPARRLRRIYRHPQRQCLAPCRRHRPRHRLDLRSVRQRRPHRLAMGSGRRGRADHRRRPDRRDGGRGGPPRRRPPRRHHRRQRLPPRPRRAARRDPHRQRRQGEA